MTNTKQTVLTDEQNAIIAARFPDDPANACRAQSAIVEILSKLHVADKPVAWIRKNGFRFSADIEPKDDSEIPLYAAPQASARAAEKLLIAKSSQQRVGDADERAAFNAWIESVPDIQWEGWGRREAAQAAWQARAALAAHKPDGGDVTLRRGIEQWTASDPSSMSKQSPEAIYYALD